jgi:hypothetical protein
MIRRLAPLLLLQLCAACATARLTGRPLDVAADPGERRVVVLEPFFEDAEWLTKTRLDQEQVITSSGRVGMITVERRYAEKPVFARVEILADEYRGVLAEMRRLRPNWQVLSTSELPVAQGPVSVVRVIVGPGEIAGSNRPLKSLACGFGFILPPLWIFSFTPVEEVQRVHGQLQRFDADAADVRARLLRYPTQPDFAVDTRGLVPANLPFAVDLEYEEGIFASEKEREPVLVSGFIQRLAAATVVLVEGRR